MEIRCDGCTSAEKICMGAKVKGTKSCPTLNSRKVLKEASALYGAEAVKGFARQAAIQEAECYADRAKKPFVLHPVKPRLLETIEFAERMGYRKLGLGFCIGMAREAAELAAILEMHDFELVCVCCKVGGVPKEFLGLGEEEKILIGEYEPMCNPIAQALILNEENTEFNILMGLCVGHDSLFLQNVEGPTTVFAVKDRVTGHNPMAALYTAHSYYQRLKKTEFEF